MLNQMLGTFQKMLTRRAGADSLAQRVCGENIAEPVFRVARDPAITLGDISPRVYAEKFIRTIFSPDAENAGVVP